MTSTTELAAAPGLNGVKELLEGPSGTGKTYAIGTCVDWCEKNNIEVFVLFTESGLEALLGYWTDNGKPVPANLHWHVLDSKTLSMTQLKDQANKIGNFSYETLTKMTDATRGQNNAFEKLLSVCFDFEDHRTGKKFGAVDSWGPDRFFWLDGLTELVVAITKMVIGNKPTMAPPEYGMAQNSLMNFLRLCTNGMRCHFGLIAHVSREKDEISGGIKLMTKAIGTAISGDIPPLFSDVIYTVREGKEFTWDTSTSQVDVKTRNLPIAAKIKPDFGQILDKWKARAQAATPASSK